MEEDEDDNALHSIERSSLSSAQSSGSVRKSSSSRKRVKDETGEPRKQNRRSGRSKKRPLFIIVILIAVIIFFLTTTFAKATISLTLASSDVSIDGVFTAVREPSQVSNGISYSRRGPYDETREALITTITKEPRSTRAEGTITVYNLHTEPMRLINRTRFQTQDGRIYRLKGQQTVPAGTESGDKILPGEKEVTVEGDEIGTTYNLNEKNVRFTIPGLANTPNFKSSYALSKEKIVGGFDGERFIPDEEEEKQERDRLRREIEKSLRDTLAQSLDNNSLKDRVVFESGIFIVYESLENEQRDESVALREKGTLYAISFREADLAGLLAQYTSGSAPKNIGPAYLDETNLVMEMEKGEEKKEEEEFDIVASTEFTFRLSGSAKLFWDVDQMLFLSDIVGKNRSEIEELIVSQYPQVTRINDISIFPMWRASMPGNKAKIQIDIGHGTDPVN